MELLLPPAVLLGFTIGWFTTRKRQMLTFEDHIQHRFHELVSDMCEGYIRGDITRPIELLEPRPYGRNHFIQFRIMATIVPNDFTRNVEPDLLVIKT